MTMDVRQIQPRKELENFFQFLYEDTQGYVYSATKDPSSGSWTTYFFEWPQKKEELIDHVQRHRSTKEVYTAPSLFRTAEATKEAWLGSHVLWAEFDYGVPNQHDLPGSIPSPAFRVRSSTESHEHWYWKIEAFEDSVEVFEQTSRRIAYGLQADLGTWNCNRVLRPPTTVHHESGRQVLGLTGYEETSVRVTDFINLPNPPQGEVEIDGDLPEIIELIAKYEWRDDVFAKFRTKELSKGERSDALCWISYECAAMGMENNEILAVLFNCDERWKKFAGRNDRLDQLTLIVGRARLKYPTGGAESLAAGGLPLMGINTFSENVPDVEWVFKDVMATRSLTTFVSPPGLGKTQLTLQIAIHLALGEKYLCFKPEGSVKTVFMSLEMGAASLNHFVSQMLQGYTQEQRAVLNEYLLVIPLGYGMSLDKSKDQIRLLDALESHEAEGLWVDSLTTSVGESTNDDEAITRSFDFYKRELLEKRGMFTWAIHHPRKAQVGNKKPNTLDDMRGSGVIANHSDLVLSLWAEYRGGPLTLSSLKTRMTPSLDELRLRRAENLNFEIIDESEPYEGPILMEGENVSSQGSSRLSI